MTSRIHLVSLVNEWASNYIEHDFDDELLERQLNFFFAPFQIPFHLSWFPLKSRLDQALTQYGADAKEHLLESRSKERASLSYRPVTNLCLKLVATTEQLEVVLFKVKMKLKYNEMT